MAFVKLDCGILNSTLWIDREAREVFLTALLMAAPKSFEEPIDELYLTSTRRTGVTLPPGWYGFVPAAGQGIVRMAGIDPKTGMKALERLCSPDGESRTADHEGRRLMRVDGGFVILNYMKYREKDHTAAARARRSRERKAALLSTDQSTDASRRDVTPVHPNVTQAEAEADKSKPMRDRPVDKKFGEKPKPDWRESRANAMGIHPKPGESAEAYAARLEHGEVIPQTPASAISSQAKAQQAITEALQARMTAAPPPPEVMALLKPSKAPEGPENGAEDEIPF